MYMYMYMHVHVDNTFLMFPSSYVEHADYRRPTASLSSLYSYDVYWHCAPLPFGHAHLRLHPPRKAGIQGFLHHYFCTYVHVLLSCIH